MMRTQHSRHEYVRWLMPDQPAKTTAPLAQFAAVVVAVESLLLIALGVAGLLLVGHTGVTEQAPTYVWGFRTNAAHSVLLIATAVLGVPGLFWHVWLRRYLVAETICYGLLYVFGTASSFGATNATMWNLNGADHLLHASVWIVSLALVIMVYARTFERSGEGW